jgi:hypothetical protein
MSALVGSGGPWRWSSRAMLCVVAVPGRVVAPLPNGVASGSVRRTLQLRSAVSARRAPGARAAPPRCATGARDATTGVLAVPSTPQPSPEEPPARHRLWSAAAVTVPV